MKMISQGLLPINPSFDAMKSKFIDEDIKKEFKDKPCFVSEVINLQLAKNTKKLAEEMAEANRIERIKLGEEKVKSSLPEVPSVPLQKGLSEMFMSEYQALPKKGSLYKLANSRYFFDGKKWVLG